MNELARMLRAKQRKLTPDLKKFVQKYAYAHLDEEVHDQLTALLKFVRAADNIDRYLDSIGDGVMRSDDEQDAIDQFRYARKYLDKMSAPCG